MQWPTARKAKAPARTLVTTTACAKVASGPYLADLPLNSGVVK